MLYHINHAVHVRIRRELAQLRGESFERAHRANRLEEYEDEEDEEPVNARGASLAGWRDRWQLMDDDAPSERGGPLLGGLAALAEKEEGEQYESD
jgi:hypothetical protein